VQCVRCVWLETALKENKSLTLDITKLNIIFLNIYNNILLG